MNKLALYIETCLLLFAIGCRNTDEKNIHSMEKQVQNKAAINNEISQNIRFLFDAAHGETAGNADWVIDQDNFVPETSPTPAQSEITSSTPETFWTGGISSWGIALAQEGIIVETLPAGTKYSFGKKDKKQDLSQYDVLVVNEPNIRFTDKEKVAVLDFVFKGGGLFMVADHTKSDRNHDGWDSPDIWNDLMENNSTKSNPFGFAIDYTNITQRTNNVLTDKRNNVILNGSQGDVSQLDFHNGATISIQPEVNPGVLGLIWKKNVVQGNSQIMCASSTFGKGRVFVVADSSPLDDGTGAPGNKLYIGWSRFSHKQLFMNASLWLAKLQ